MWLGGQPGPRPKPGGRGSQAIPLPTAPNSPAAPFLQAPCGSPCLHVRPTMFPRQFKGPLCLWLTVEPGHIEPRARALSWRATSQTSCPIFIPECRRWLCQVSIQNNCTNSCCCNGLDCLPVANGTTGAQGFFPALSHQALGSAKM
jgi:hypothetical protein